MKQVRLPQTVEYRLSSYARQAQQFFVNSANAKSTLYKSSLMALAPLAAASLFPSTTKACSFSMTFPAPMANSSVCFKVDLPYNGTGATDFSFIYLNSTGGNFKNLIAGAQGGNGLQTTMVMGYPIIPQLNYGSPVPTTGFVANTNAAIYSGTPGSYIASPSAPLSYPIHIAINTGGEYGFLSITISGGTVTIVGGINNTPGSSALVGDCSSVLPVEITSFQAKANESNIVLEWETATEINNLGFELQRSTNANDFHKIAWVEGAGTTSEVQRYAFKDEKVKINQLYYYRLMQVDTDGSVEYSDITNASVKSIEMHSVGMIYPNPVQQFAILPLDIIKREEIQVTVFDNQGRKIQYIQQFLDEGSQEFPIDMSHLVSGSYFTKIDLGSETVYRKIIKID